MAPSREIACAVSSAIMPSHCSDSTSACVSSAFKGPSLVFTRNYLALLAAVTRTRLTPALCFWDGLDASNDILTGFAIVSVPDYVGVDLRKDALNIVQGHLIVR